MRLFQSTATTQTRPGRSRLPTLMLLLPESPESHRMRCTATMVGRYYTCRTSRRTLQRNCLRRRLLANKPRCLMMLCFFRSLMPVSILKKKFDMFRGLHQRVMVCIPSSAEDGGTLSLAMNQSSPSDIADLLLQRRRVSRNLPTENLYLGSSVRIQPVAGAPAPKYSGAPSAVLRVVVHVTRYFYGLIAPVAWDLAPAVQPCRPDEYVVYRTRSIEAPARGPSSDGFISASGLGTITGASPSAPRAAAAAGRIVPSVEEHRAGGSGGNLPSAARRPAPSWHVRGLGGWDVKF